MTFWDVIWFIVVSFAFIFYLMMLFSIISDLFADRETGGFAKAIWIIFLLFVPLITALIYLIARGDGMAKRSARAAAQAQERTDDYIRSVGTSSPAEQIKHAKAMLDEGTLTQEEYDALKRKALA